VEGRAFRLGIPDSTKEYTKRQESARHDCRLSGLKTVGNMFEKILQSMKMPVPVTEHHFHPKRKWRFDYAWPNEKLALEVEGGVWVGGRHNRATGFLKDMEKYNTAAMMGWRIIRVTPKQLLTTETIELIKKLLKP
jgi:very-short-patch-repair endonuclease